MLKNTIILLFFLMLGTGGYYFYESYQNKAEKDTSIWVPAKKGEFKINVIATGELQAAKSEKILGPQGMRSVGVFHTTIAEIVAEGTLVEKGGYVATLDRTELGNKMKSMQTEIDKARSQILQAQLDTAIQMRGLRDQIQNIKFSMEEKKLEAKMNVYEPPAVQRQTQLELERLQRDLIQSEESYKLKREQAEAKITEMSASVQQYMDQLEMMDNLTSEFTIKAPKSGMVIYERSWNGKKGPGSRITAWDPVVAQLPDLSNMISITYVNEVDISKVSVGQPVTIQIDAFPDKQYTGLVLSIANIGEQRPNFDAKVFEVKIEIDQSDSILRPAMTTANIITTKIFNDVVFIPLEALHSNDSITYVFLKKDRHYSKQEVIAGSANENEVIIKAGLSENQQIVITIPLESEKILIDLLPDSVKKELAKKSENISSKVTTVPKKKKKGRGI